MLSLWVPSQKERLRFGESIAGASYVIRITPLKLPAKLKLHFPDIAGLGSCRVRVSEINVQSGVDQAGRLIKDVHRQARAYFAGNSEIDEPTAGDLWEKASPGLERALAIYEKKESPNTPSSKWIPVGTTKKTCQKDIETNLDTVLAVLGTCGAAGYRTRIRNLQADIATSQVRIARYRETSHGGPREQLTANIAANRRNIDACRLMAETLKSHRRCVLEENRKVQVLGAAAVNSYRTVCLSLNVAELIGYCEAAFRALRELRLPPLRTFQNAQLNDELQKLAARMVGKE